MPVPRVLIAEDDEATAKLIRILLSKAGIDSIHAPNGAVALALATTPQPPDLVLLDVMMPELNGLEVLAELRQRNPSDPAVILLTAMGETDVRVNALGAGADDFVAKPFHPQELLARVKTHLRIKALRDHVEERNHELEKLSEKLRRGLDRSLRTMSEMMEAFDAQLGGHCRRAAEIARDLASGLGLPSEEVAQVEYAARLMDVGLVGIPKELVNKSEEAMTLSERLLYRHHPVLGSAIVQNVEGLESAARYVRHHHERFGGAGYPDGLKGRHIPLGARILAVADRYDRLLEERRRLGETAAQEALYELLKERHTNLDPDVVGTLRQKVLPARNVPIDERGLKIEDLQEGMRLSRDVKTPDGRLLLTRNVRLTRPFIDKLVNYDRLSPLLEDVFVYH